MIESTVETRPQRYARTGGALYLFIIIAALFGEGFVRGHLIVPGDAAATAARILGAETLFRAGLAAEMLTCVCDVSLALILYVLLRPVDRNLALLAAFFRLTFVGIYAVSKLFEIVALVLLGHAGDLEALEPQQLHALAYASLRVHGLGYGASLLFFGFSCLLVGRLIQRSTYLPGLIGALLIAGGLGYVVFSLAQLLSPAFAARLLFPWLMLPGFVSELALTLWLLVKGVDVAKWETSVQGAPFRQPSHDR